MGFDNQLGAVERTLQAKIKDYEELLLLSGDANHAREVSHKSSMSPAVSQRETAPACAREKTSKSLMGTCQLEDRLVVCFGYLLDTYAKLR